MKVIKWLYQKEEVMRKGRECPKCPPQGMDGNADMLHYYGLFLYFNYPLQNLMFLNLNKLADALVKGNPSCRATKRNYYT